MMNLYARQGLQILCLEALLFLELQWWCWEKYSNFHISTIILPDYQHSYTIISEIAFLNLAELPSLIMKVSSLPGPDWSSLVSWKSNVSLLLSLNCNLLAVLVSVSLLVLPLMVLLMTAGPGGSDECPLKPTTISQKLNGRSSPQLSSAFKLS